MSIDNEYDIGDVVFLKTDINQFERIVTAIVITQNNIFYTLAYDTTDSTHYGFEISHDKNKLKTMLE